MLKFHSLRVAELRTDAEDAVAMALEVPNELRAEYTGLPGQHVVLRMELDGEEIRRTYSLINTPGEWPLRIVARIHENGRMSRFLAGQLKVGDMLDVLPPNGSLAIRAARPAPVSATYVAFVGGSGITPVLSVIKSVLQQSRTSRVVLFYGNSGLARVMCLEELLSLKDRYLDRLALHFLMSREPQEVGLYNGRVDGAKVFELSRTLFRPEQVEQYFLCGPGDMIEQVSGALEQLGISPERIHAERFTLARGNCAQPDTTEPRGGHLTSEVDSVEVTVLMDGRRRTFSMRMNGETILEGAARAGLDLPFSCRAGVCSTCRTKVVAGEVEMAQNYALEDWELQQGYVLACQSRARSRTLELDYDEK